MKTNITMLAPVFATLLLAGCATEPTPTERNFGESVRQMIRAQTYDPGTLTSPSDAVIDNTDGQMLEGVLETYRETVANPDSVGNEITINVGGQ